MLLSKMIKFQAILSDCQQKRSSMKQSTGITMQIMSVLFYMFGMAFSESDLNLKQLKLQVDKLTDAVLIVSIHHLIV